jgi:hypothetical protein
MTIIEELSAALVKADAAGNTADAKALADAIRQMQPQAAAEPVQPLAPGMSSGVPTGESQTIQSGPSTDFGVGQRQESPLAAISEAATGAKRQTEASQFFPDWRNNLPEFSLTKGKGAFKALGVAASTMTASPEETAKIVKAQYPDVNVLQDDKGNYFFESGIDKKIYAIPPGFGATDIPRAVVAGAMFAPAAGATTAAGRIIGTGLTQAGIETGQAAMGGEFNAADIPFAAATQGLFETVAARNAIKQSVGELLGSLLQKEKASMPGQFISAAGELTSAVPASISAEMGGALSPTQAAVVSAQMQAEMGGALDREARAARFNQYIGPTGERIATAPFNLTAEASGGLGYPEGRFISTTGQFTPSVPANIRAEMRGALNTPPPPAQFVTSNGMTGEIPAGIRAEMGGALSREMPSPPAAAPVAPTAQAPMAVEAATAAPREVSAQRAPEPAPVAAPSAQLTAGERAKAGTLSTEELGGIIKKASSNGIGSTKAKEELASLVGENPQIRTAVESLGIDVPPDVLSDNQQIRKAIGLTRSEVGSPAEAQWLNTLKTATARADDLMASIDASKDISLVSENVRRKMTSTRQDLENKAKELYTQAEAFDAASTVDLKSVKALLDERLRKLGGKVESLHPKEARLYKILKSNPEEATYEFLKTEKTHVGDALRGRQAVSADSYGSMAERDLSNLNAAFARDQIDNVSRLGGEEAGRQIKGANLLYAQNRALGNRIVNIFGKDEVGSVASLMQSAIKTGSKGDTVRIGKLLRSIPQEDAALRKEVVATAINDLSLSKTGDNAGNFSFSRFADTWSGIQRNSEMLRVVSKELGPEATGMLKNLYVASKEMASSEKNVLHTGKANQILIDILNAESRASKILSTGTGKAAAAAAGAVFGGPVGAAAGTALQNMLSKGSKQGVKRAGELFAAPEFKAMIQEQARKGEISQKSINRIAISRAWNKFKEAIR